MALPIISHEALIDALTNVGQTRFEIQDKLRIALDSRLDEKTITRRLDNLAGRGFLTKHKDIGRDGKQLITYLITCEQIKALTLKSKGKKGKVERVSIKDLCEAMKIRNPLRLFQIIDALAENDIYMNESALRGRLKTLAAQEKLTKTTIDKQLYYSLNEEQFKSLWHQEHKKREKLPEGKVTYTWGERVRMIPGGTVRMRGKM